MECVRDTADGCHLALTARSCDQLVTGSRWHSNREVTWWPYVLLVPAIALLFNRIVIIPKKLDTVLRSA